MKREVIFYVIVVLLSLCGCRNRGEDQLKAVDAAIAAADAAQDSLRRSIEAADLHARTVANPAQRFAAGLAVADRYTSFDLVKAIDQVNQCLTLSKNLDAGARTEALMRLASIYNSQGQMLTEAVKIYDSISPAGLSKADRLAYYTLGVQLNRSLHELSIDPEQTQRYSRAMVRMRDSVLAIAPESQMIAANRLIDAGDYKGAQQILLKDLPDDVMTPGVAPRYHVLARTYRLQNDTENERLYLVKAAAADLRNGVREYMALPELAAMLFEAGDIDRAYRYIHRSYNDAKACHASRRLLEISPLIPLIDAAYNQQKETEIQFIAAVGGLVLIALLAALLFYIAIHRKNRKLSSYAAELADTNDRLAEAYASESALNKALANESRVKQTYITGFMELCLDYLRKMESFRAELAKIAARRNLDSLIKAINSSRYVNREIAEFYQKFDDAFSSLYPDFIPRLNTLLRDECQYDPSAGFSTDLRIYALIRLGIESSSSIARFLRCSDSTVYNYRTQMRRRAKDRHNFEEDFRRTC